MGDGVIRPGDIPQPMVDAFCDAESEAMQRCDAVEAARAGLAAALTARELPAYPQMSTWTAADAAYRAARDGMPGAAERAVEMLGRLVAIAHGYGSERGDLSEALADAGLAVVLRKDLRTWLDMSRDGGAEWTAARDRLRAIGNGGDPDE